MIREKYYFLMGFVLLAFVVRCSKSDDNPAGPGGGQPPQFQVVTVAVPQAMTQAAANNPMVNQAVQFMNLANGMAGYTAFFTPPAGTNSLAKNLNINDGPWTSTWTSGTLTITLTISETNTGYSWIVRITGTYKGYTVEDWKLVEAVTSQDGSQGNMVAYQPVTTDVLIEWMWIPVAQGTVALVYEKPGGQIEINVTSYSDGSGKLEHYENFVLKFKVTWNADGSGSWWTYEGGTQTDTGTWP